MVAMCCSLPLPLPSSSTSRSPDILQLHQHCQHYCHQMIWKFEMFLELFADDQLPMYQKTLQPILDLIKVSGQVVKLFFSSRQGRGTSFSKQFFGFLYFSITERLQSSSSGERTVSADGPTINIYSEQRVARLPSPFFLTIKVWLMVTGVKSIV